MTHPSRILVVCTANVCRSPVAERLLQRHLDEQGISAVVRSAGTRGGHDVVHRDTARAAGVLDVDLGAHVSRPLTREILDTDGADLVVTMTREHLRHVVEVDPDAWPRTFTLREVLRRAARAPSPGDAASGSSLASWRASVADGRTVDSMMGDDPADDVPDPFGGPAAGHTAMVTELDDLTESLGRLLGTALR